MVASPRAVKPDGGKAKWRAEGVEGVPNQKRIPREACVEGVLSGGSRESCVV